MKADFIDWVATDLPPLATREQLAAAAQLHVRTIDRALARGELVGVQLGRSVRIPRAAVRAWFARGARG